VGQTVSSIGCLMGFLNFHILPSHSLATDYTDYRDMRNLLN
jgi:hypothetical protein